MNGRASKQIRRDLRRVIGAEGVNVLDEHTQLLQSGIVPSLGVLDKRLTADAQRCDERLVHLSDADAMLGRRIDRIEDALFTLRVSFWQRVRWFIGI